MAHIPHISSTDNPRIKAVIALRKARQRRRSGLFVAEGWREVERAERAGLEIEELFTCAELLGSKAPQWKAARRYTVALHAFGRMCYRDEPEGVLAVVRQPRWDLEQVAGRPAEAARLWLVAVGLSKPGNLGAMARTAVAAGAGVMLVADGAADAFNPNALRVSTGACYVLPIFTMTTAEALPLLHRHGVRPLCAHPAAETPCFEADLRDDIALVIGAEDRGLDAAWLEAGLAVTIPLQSDMIDSLNASVAAGILLFEAVRQRRSAGNNDR